MKIKIDAGKDIASAVQEACRLAMLENQNVDFDFNGIELIARPESYWRDICDIYCLHCELRRFSKPSGKYMNFRMK